MKLAANQIVNLDGCSGMKISVAVAGRELPLKIGDQVLLGNSLLPKTVVGISVSDDMRVVYSLEWYNADEGSFQQQAVTFNELMLLRQRSRPEEMIGFGLPGIEEKKLKKKRKASKKETGKKPEKEEGEL